jgi:nucleotide-binding universal stress UspA family protein
LATDWSPASEKALEYLTAFKNVMKKVDLTHVIGVKIAKGLDKTELHKMEKESKQRLAEGCDFLKSRGIDAEPHLFAGRTALQIVDGAREHDASLIVMGTSGKDCWRGFCWLGSVSYRVAETSELPVLLVP